MKKIVAALNIILTVCFFVFANFLFWINLLGLLGITINGEVTSEILWHSIVEMIFALFLMYGSIMFFMKTKAKYLYGLIMIGIVLIETIVYRLVYITHGKLEQTDLLNFLFFSIPFIFVLFVQYLDKKYIEGSKISKNYIVCLIIIVSIVLIIGGILIWQYLTTPENEIEITDKDETANWQTYQNDKFGFEIKYPEGTKITDIDADSGYFFMQIPFSLNKTKLTDKMLRIHVAATEFHYGVETPASCSIENNIGSVIINGITFNKRDASGEFGGTEGAAIATEYCTMKNNLAFKLVFTLDYNRYSQLSDFDQKKEFLIFNQMLSTFRFIEAKFRTTGEQYIKLTSPDRLVEEGNSYIIRWEQKGLEGLGNKVVICLEGFDVNGKAISVKESWWSPDCAYKSGGVVSSYLVIKTTLTTESYSWTIPKDVTEKFDARPYNFKINLLVFDELPPGEGTTEWGGLIAQDESDNYFNIWKNYKNIEQGFEIKYPNNWTPEVKQPSYLCQEGPGYECLASIQFSPPFPLVKTLKDIDLVIVSNPNDYSASGWIEKYTPEILSNPKTSLDKNIRIGENNWEKLLTIINTRNQRVAFSVAKNNKFFSFGTTIGQGMEEAENILNQMLSTFRFF
jgi:cell division protein FtsL